MIDTIWFNRIRDMSEYHLDTDRTQKEKDNVDLQNVTLYLFACFY